jgi:beta-galactosidase/beta-glucuronidase
MAEPHVIRLRGPWQYEPLERFQPLNLKKRGRESFSEMTPVPFSVATASLPPGGKTDVPSDWASTLGSDFRGRVRYTRPFNCPTNLDPGERVWLVCEGVAGSAELTLNGQPILTLAAPNLSGSCDITDRLAPHNTLVVEVTARPGDNVGGITGEVRLEIRRG